MAITLLVIITLVYLSMGYGAVKATREEFGSIKVLTLDIILNWAYYTYTINKLSKLTKTDKETINLFVSLFNNKTEVTMLEAGYFATETLKTLKGE